MDTFELVNKLRDKKQLKRETKPAPGLARREEMRRLRFEEGLSLVEVGKRMGVSKQRVHQVLGNSGHYFTFARGYKIETSTDKTNKELACELGVAETTIAAHRNGKRHAIDPDSNVGMGAIWEEWVSRQLERMGYKNELMPHRHPFDILVEGIARVDVKACSISKGYAGSVSPLWSFNTTQREGSIDFFICAIVPTEDVFIIPASKVTLGQIRFAFPTKRKLQSNYQQYHDAWYLIGEYIELLDTPYNRGKEGLTTP